MASVRFSPALPPSRREFTSSSPPPPPSPTSVPIADDDRDDRDDGSGDEVENIPYHARENARPFTYGTLPAGFRTSDLHHVVFEESSSSSSPSFAPFSPSSFEESKRLKAQAAVTASPSTGRKSTRPSISPSRPLLRKTPTRQEFEEMLLERREQSLREQRTHAVQQAQNAAIQRDLDELQQALSGHISRKPEKSSVLRESSSRIVDVETRTLQTEENVPAALGAEMQENDFEGPGSHAVAVVTPDATRPETPAFPPVPKRPLDERCISPYPMVTPGTPTLQRLHPSTVGNAHSSSSSKQTPAPKKAMLSGSSALPASEPHDVAPHLVKFAKDYSEFWYRPHISREEAISLLRSALPGTFIIRNSTTYKSAFGLVVRVEKPPQGVVVAENSSGEELVRHFLVEPTTRGVRLKGCANEPVFTSLSALVYQHSISSLALPIKLKIPDRDLLLSAEDSEAIAAQKQLLMQGAACNVLYLCSSDMESLTGDEAVRKAVGELFAQRPPPAQPTEVHFKVSQQGITLTDNSRRLFFRRHYAAHQISYCGIDPESRLWSVMATGDGGDGGNGGNGADGSVVNKTIFAFVARPLGGCSDNQCHLFCDLAATQPASAIVSFANKVVCMDKRDHRML